MLPILVCMKFIFIYLIRYHKTKRAVIQCTKIQERAVQRKLKILIKTNHIIS